MDASEAFTERQFVYDKPLKLTTKEDSIDGSDEVDSDSLACCSTSLDGRDSVSQDSVSRGSISPNVKEEIPSSSEERYLGGPPGLIPGLVPGIPMPMPDAMFYPSMLMPNWGLPSSLAARKSPPRPRSQKTSIPDDCKDDRYFERRKRNNAAARKSRDIRKRREMEIAVRANFLEKENAYLKAQVAVLRDEADSLIKLLNQKSNTS